MGKSTLKGNLEPKSNDFFQIGTTENKSESADSAQDIKYEAVGVYFGETSPRSAKSLSVPSDVDGNLSDSFTNDLTPEIIIEANRAVTRRIPLETRKKLISEHQNLVRKKYGDGLSRREERRLNLVRWELDRIDDAEIGPQMNVLEAFTDANEQFAHEIEKLMNQLNPSVLGAKHKKKRNLKKS